MNNTGDQPVGMRSFLIIWLGQVISLFGTTMTVFALTIWAWETTGSATSLSLLVFAFFLPNILFTPIAGVMADRWDRKRVMILADLGAGLSTVALLLLYSTGHLQVWHIYVTEASAGIFQAFHFPAYYASLTMIVPKKHYARASGMISTAQSFADIAAPLVASVLVGIINVNGVMIIDIFTFIAAITTLLIISIPKPAASEAGLEAKGSFWNEAAFGFRYIFQRSSLLGLQLIFLAANLAYSLNLTLVSPMVLARTDNNEIALGVVQSAAGIGGVIGGLLLSAWGGPKRRIHGVLVGIISLSLLGNLAMALGYTALMWSVAAFLFAFFLPVINGSNQAIWQVKVPADVQGRVFAARRLIAQSVLPAAMLLAGPLADRVFEPAMTRDGSLATFFGRLIGTSTGSGMALMFLFAGLFGVLAGLAGYAIRVVRQVEDILPDYEAVVAQA